MNTWNPSIAIAHLSKALLLTATLFMLSPSYAEQPSLLLNINNATLEQLESIKGIGNIKAQAIIDFRTKNGDFKNITDLTQVKGIGPRFIEKNQSVLSLADPK